MTFTDVIAALIIMSLFLVGFSQASEPVLTSWENAVREYRSARSIEFVAKSFRNELAKEDWDIERWKKAVSVVPELQNYDFTEYERDGSIRAVKLSCVISGEPIEIIGHCGP
jgi:hypothetical protein